VVNVTDAADEPPITLAEPRDLLDAYLDYYRAALLRKLDGLGEQDMRTSRLPSGWTPLELLVHLTYVEQRWFRWAFLAEQVAEPWGDRGPGGKPGDPWRVPAEVSVADAIAAFTAEVERSKQAVAGASLAEQARPGGRIATPDQAPTLAWIMFHVLQEYARHLGHLDVVRELIDGALGE